MKKSGNILEFPFHSILLCIYPLLYVYTRNIMFLSINDTFRFLLVSLIITICVLLIFRILLKSWEKSGIFCSLLLIMFFSFGQVANLVERWLLQSGCSFNISIFLWIWLAFYGVLFLWVAITNLPQSLDLYLNIMSVILILFPLITILSTATATQRGGELEYEILAQIRGDMDAVSSMPETDDSEKPNIYYIILDAYTRADVLQELYDYDNSPFIDALEDRGFYIVDSSRSNYMNTTYSLNTSLNLIYFHEFPLQIFQRARYDLKTNYVNQFLGEQGYQIVVYDSGTGDTNYQYADIFVSPIPQQTRNKNDFNSFEQLFLRTTMGLLLYTKDPYSNTARGISQAFIESVNNELDLRRERIRFALKHLPDYTTQPGRYFLFSHIYLPHFPFLYGQNQEELEYHQNVNLYWYEVDPEDYIEYYTYQLDYLNQALMNTIDSIIAETDKPLVIIIQGDHGDEKYLDWDEPDAQGVYVRTAILNAIYYSDGDYEMLYPSMTPVNTFRVVLNKWFGTSYPLLADHSYSHEHSLATPYNRKPEFADICFQFDICTPESR